jgi:hypothetical protein
VIVNYKKREKCPYVNPEYSNLIINQNSVSKFTCEQVSELGGCPVPVQLLPRHLRDPGRRHAVRAL